MRDKARTLISRSVMPFRNGFTPLVDLELLIEIAPFFLTVSEETFSRSAISLFGARGSATAGHRPPG